VVLDIGLVITQFGNFLASSYNGSVTNSYRLETINESVLFLDFPPALFSLLKSSLTAAGLNSVVASSSSPPSFSGFDQLVLFDSGSSLPPKLDFSSSSLPILFAHLARVGDLSSLSHNFRLVFYTDVFGPNFTCAPTLTAFLNQAITTGKLILPGDGLASYRLLYDTDLVEGLSHYLTSTAPSSPAFLAPRAGISLLSLAYLIRSHLPRPLTLSFSPSFSWFDHSLDELKFQASLRELSWQPSFDLSAALSTYLPTYLPSASSLHLSRLSDLATETSAKKVLAISPNPSPKSPSPRLEFVPLARRRERPSFPHLSLPRPLKLISSSLALAFALYLFILAGSLTITLLTLASFRSLAHSQLLPSSATLRLARPPALFLEANLVALNVLPSPARLPLAGLTRLMTSYRYSLETLSQARSLASTATRLFTQILPSSSPSTKGGDLVETLSLTRLQTDTLYESLSLLDGSLPVDPPAPLPTSLHSDYLALKDNLRELRKYTLTAKALLATAPDLLGVGDRRKYLVLFQNNMELRATGGFIGSFAILGFENGVLYDFPVYDVYAADGALSGHVEPPPALKEHLGEANWYLRDSNWDPDFPSSARRAEWFLEKTLSLDVQGTIAINIYTLSSLLEALGSVELPDYQETITSDNIFERAEYHSEVNFFPGSQQKKEFLASIADALYQRLSSLQVADALPVLKALASSLDEKNTLLAVASPSSHQTFSTLGWTGALTLPTCPSLEGNCYSDHALLVDNNVGVNKANYFLRRELALSVNIDKDRYLSHQLTATYHNTSTSSSWPAGPYKSYSRLYLPADAVLDDLIIGGESVKKDQLDRFLEHDRRVFGYLLEVPTNSTLEVVVRYHLTNPLPTHSPLYSFYWQKQSGTAPDPLTITLNHPLYLEPVVVSPPSPPSPQQLQFDLSNITDRRITIKFR